jgi:hypothetical protein
MGGIIVGLLLLASFFLTVLTQENHATAQPRTDPKQDHIEGKIGECRAVGAFAQLDPAVGYLGCNFPVLGGERR